MYTHNYKLGKIRHRGDIDKKCKYLATWKVIKAPAWVLTEAPPAVSAGSPVEATTALVHQHSLHGPTAFTTEPHSTALDSAVAVALVRVRGTRDGRERRGGGGRRASTNIFSIAPVLYAVRLSVRRPPVTEIKQRRVGSWNRSGL